MRHLDFNDLTKVNSARTLEWEGHPLNVNDLLYCSNELGGEAGEAQNVVKKLSRHLRGIRGGVEPELAVPHLAEELADVVICADRVAQCLGIDLAAAIVKKFNKTSDKNGLTIKFNEDDFL